MKIYFLRHAHATWPDWPGPDRERPLTAKGRKQARRVSAFLKNIGAQPGAIVTSPLKRAAQTAEIVAENFGFLPDEDPLLGPGFDAEKLVRILKSHPFPEVILVGHEPDFSDVISQLTGGRVEMAKAGLACVGAGDEGMDSRLLWLVTPKLLKSL